MRIYLMRHGEALAPREDPQQSLSPEGLAHVEKIAFFMQQQSLFVPVIFHSEKKRAQQTAQRIRELAQPEAQLTLKKNLAPNDPPQEIADEIRRLNHDFMIVGHLPFMARLTALLVAGVDHAPVFEFKPATLVMLEGEHYQPLRVIGVVHPEML